MTQTVHPHVMHTLDGYHAESDVLMPKKFDSRKPPPQKDDDKQSESRKGSVLSNIQLELPCRSMIFRGDRFTCFSINSQFILTAAFRYFLLSSRSLPLISPILSKLSPRYSKSSMFFVMTCVTSFSSSFSLFKFDDALTS